MRVYAITNSTRLAEVKGSCKILFVLIASYLWRVYMPSITLIRTFHGDGNGWVKGIQGEERSYFGLVHSLYRLADKKYRFSVQVIGQETELLGHLRAARGWSLFMGEEVCDAVAAAFRFRMVSPPALEWYQLRQ